MGDKSRILYIQEPLCKIVCIIANSEMFFMLETTELAIVQRNLKRMRCLERVFFFFFSSVSFPQLPISALFLTLLCIHNLHFSSSKSQEVKEKKAKSVQKWLL